MDDLCHCSFFTGFLGLLVTMVTRLNTDMRFAKKTFPNMDLDLSTYVFHYDKEKTPILNLSFSRLWLRNHKVIGECAMTESGQREGKLKGKMNC